MSSEEMEAALDDILGKEDESVTETTDDAVDAVDVVEEVAEVDEPDEKPKGFISYDDWVADGKDPDLWQGKKKYSETYDLIKETRELNKTVGDMKDIIKSTAETAQDMKHKAYQEGRADAEARLAQAVEDDDVKGAMAAKEELDSLVPPQPKANPVHQQFFSANERLTSDPEMMSEFERIYNGKLRNDGVHPNQPLSEAAIKGYMNAALKATKDIFPEKFESSKNSRSTTSKASKRSTTKVDASKRLNDVTISRNNPRDSHPLKEMYEELKRRDPEEAENFAKRMMGEK